VPRLDDLDEKEKQARRYFSRQIVDMFSPTNFLATNPDALARAVETEGKAWSTGSRTWCAISRRTTASWWSRWPTRRVRGRREHRHHRGQGGLSQPDDGADPVRAHHRKVHETPLLIFPPWINKFYILDLKPQNSLIRWIVDQGYTLFVVSWINPDASYADVGMETYIEEGYLRDPRGEGDHRRGQVNAVGYCIAGTTLSLTLALLKKRGDDTVKSATFFTALTDFSDQGEFTPFLQDDFVDGIEEGVPRRGMLPQFHHVADLLLPALERPDLRARRSQLHDGRDAAGLRPALLERRRHQPAGAMAVEYLRGLCQRNEFAGRGSSFSGRNAAAVGRRRAADARSPARPTTSPPGRTSYRGVRQMGSRRTRPSSCRSRAISPGSSTRLQEEIRPLHQPRPDGLDRRGLAGRRATSTRARGGRAGKPGCSAVRQAGPARARVSRAIRCSAPAPGTYVLATKADFQKGFVVFAAVQILLLKFAALQHAYSFADAETTNGPVPSGTTGDRPDGQDQDFTKMMKDMMGAFPVDMKAMKTPSRPPPQ
jgi:hypothetical protein